MTGVDVYLSGLRLENGELLIVATDKACPDAIAIYAKRWEIETLFSCLKGRGFNLEETRVTNRVRIKRLLVVPVIQSNPVRLQFAGKPSVDVPRGTLISVLKQAGLKH